MTPDEKRRAAHWLDTFAVYEGKELLYLAAALRAEADEKERAEKEQGT